MIVFSGIIILLVFLNECNAQKEGDAIVFACITDASYVLSVFRYCTFYAFSSITFFFRSQPKFHVDVAKNSVPPTLVKSLKGKKGLSLFFHGTSHSNAVLHGKYSYLLIRKKTLFYFKKRFSIKLGQFYSFSFICLSLP